MHLVLELLKYANLFKLKLCFGFEFCRLGDVWNNVESYQAAVDHLKRNLLILNGVPDGDDGMTGLPPDGPTATPVDARGPHVMCQTWCERLVIV